MTLRSHDELSIADVFSRTLQNLLALTAPNASRTYPTVEQIVAATGDDVSGSPALFRLLQLVVLPEVLGASSGTALYVAAKRFSKSLHLSSIQALKAWLREMGLGELEVELDDERVLVKLARCLTCYRLPAVGSAICDFERGLIDGALEQITGATVTTKETLCWGLGDTVCQFEGYSGAQSGYVYTENGFHPDAQRRLLAGLEQQSAVAVDNLRLVSERRDRETRDPLTGLYNFRHLREHAALELARAARYERHVAFVMLDLDDFHLVNEQAGREGGDEVLCHWAAALTAQLRSGDLVCRYGADEFLLVLPETAESQVGLALERVLRATTSLAMEAGGKQFTLTAVGGVAIYPDDGATAEELVAKAATTMYIARASGKGQVAYFSAPPRR
jgi:diguanylate cyclase (GGDEF)-like protein